MINYFVRRGGESTLRAFLEAWQPDVSHLFRVIHYEELPDMSSLPAGAIILSDIERLNQPQRQLASLVRDAVLEQEPGTAVLNHPIRSMNRSRLLQELRRLGMNPYSVYRVTEPFRPSTYPVFLRYDSRHWGPITPLLHDRGQLERALLSQVLRRRDLADVLAVEYFDTSDEYGIYRKYGAYVIGDRVIPCHLKATSDWVAKGVTPLNESEFEREAGYIADNPHGEAIADIARIAGITYGRIDYGLLSGSLVTWEFNTNPTIASRPEGLPQSSLKRNRQVLPLLAEVFEHLSLSSEAGDVSLAGIPSEVRHAARVTLNLGQLPSSAGLRARRVLRPALRGVEPLASPFRRQILARAGVGLQPDGG